MISAELRRQIASRAFGTGVSGAVSAAAANWAWGQFKAGIRKDPERLDTTRLAPGQVYQITTRPAPGRRSRKLARREARLVARVGRTSSVLRQVKLEARLSATRKDLEQRRSKDSARRARQGAQPVVRIFS